ncbi:unnamed protein product, partial [Rotaria sordida]
QRER